jgi:hypothetical protein
MNDKPTADEISALANNPNKLVQAVNQMDKLDNTYGDDMPADDLILGASFTAKPKLEDDFHENLKGMQNFLIEKGLEINKMNEETKETEDEPIPTWELDGKTYPKYHFDGYGTQVLPIVENGETFGHIGVKFHWEKSEPFLEALDMKSERITDHKTQTTKTKSRNANIALAKLFREIVVDGFVEETDEFGNTTKTEMDAKELISDIPQEFQAKLIFEFLNALNVERYYKPGSSKLRQLMKPDDGSIFFLCKLGQFAWLMEFAVPNLDARRNYEDSIVETEQTNEEKASKVVTSIRYDFKMRFAKKYFQNVQGISLETEGQDFDGTNQDHVVKFKKYMPATWWTVLADKLAMCFDKAGK